LFHVLDARISVTADAAMLDHRWRGSRTRGHDSAIMLTPERFWRRERLLVRRGVLHSAGKLDGPCPAWLAASVQGRIWWCVVLHAPALAQKNRRNDVGSNDIGAMASARR